MKKIMLIVNLSLVSFIAGAQIEVITGGKVGIGTTAPKSNLDVEGNVAIGATYSGTTAAPTNGVIIEGKVGIGTATVPKNSTGSAMLALEGVNGSVNGPNMQFTTASTNHPLLQILNYTHDNISLNFDAYFDGSVWKSSDAGSNFQIYKASDKLYNYYKAAVSAGTTIS